MQCPRATGHLAGLLVDECQYLAGHSCHGEASAHSANLFRARNEVRLANNMESALGRGGRPTLWHAKTSDETNVPFRSIWQLPHGFFSGSSLLLLRLFFAEVGG